MVRLAEGGDFWAKTERRWRSWTCRFPKEEHARRGRLEKIPWGGLFLECLRNNRESVWLEGREQGERSKRWSQKGSDRVELVSHCKNSGFHSKWDWSYCKILSRDWHTLISNFKASLLQLVWEQAMGGKGGGQVVLEVREEAERPVKSYHSNWGDMMVA